MSVKCIFNLGEILPIGSCRLGETDETDYSFLKIGTEYIVYGLMFYSCRVDYLICSGEDKHEQEAFFNWVLR